MSASISTAVTVSNLIARADVPMIKKGKTVDASQTIAVGTALGKKTLGAITVAAAGAGLAGANTGDGTCTEVALIGGIIPVVGAYTIKCIEEVAHGGVWAMYDPKGNQIAANLRMTAGAGAATTLKAGGFSFKLTDGAEDFDAADGFSFTIAAGSGRVVVLDKTAVDGSQVIDSIALEAVTVGSGATAVIPTLEAGVVNSDVVAAASGTVLADYEADARAKGIFFINKDF
jgi:hypothetical protein